MSLSREAALALLGLSGENPSEAEINAAYKAAMQMNHPDRYANNERLRRHAEEQSKLINEARDIMLSGAWARDFGGSWSSSSARAARGYARSEEGVTSDNPRCNSEDEPASEGFRPGSSGKSEASGQRATQNDNSSQGAYRDGSETTYAAPSLSFLDGWFTPIGASIAGYLTTHLLFALIDAASSEALGVAALADIACRVLSISYALVIYPSFFTANPKIESNSAVAFLNFAAGGIVFGALWNSNLTKRSKGKSYIAFSVLAGFWVASYFAALAMAFAHASVVF